jgi:hypothetical protein
MLHASRGCPAFVSTGVNRCARRAGSFHWTFVIEHSLSIGVEKRGEPCRQRHAGSIVGTRSLGLPALAQRFATISGVACGCTYPSSGRIEIGYTPAIRQTRCICAEASFLIRRSNNSATRLYARDGTRRPMRCQSRPEAQAVRWDAMASENRSGGGLRLPRLTSRGVRQALSHFRDRAWVFGL